MDDQAGGAGPREGDYGPEPVPVVVRPRPVLEVLAEEATGLGVSHKVIGRILHAGFDPKLVEPFLIDLVPRCSRMGLFGLATLCLQLVEQTGTYHAAAQAALAAGQFTETEIGSLALYGQRIAEEPSVLWWHDAFVRFVRADLGYQKLLAEVLLRTDQPGPFVARWAEWINCGRFDGHGQGGDTHASILAVCLSDGVTRRPEVFTSLLDVAVGRWRWQLDSSDVAERRRGVVNLLQVVGARPVFAGRVQAEVLHTVKPPRFPEWESLDRTFTALLYLQAVSGADWARPAFDDAFSAALTEVHGS